jgi:hypothetical protein
LEDILESDALRRTFDGFIDFSEVGVAASPLPVGSSSVSADMVI